MNSPKNTPPSPSSDLSLCVGHQALRLSVGPQSVRVPEGRCSGILAGARSDVGAQRDAPTEVQADEGGEF